MVWGGWIVYQNDCIIKILMVGALIVLSCASIIQYTFWERGQWRIIEIVQISFWPNCTIVGKGRYFIIASFTKNSLSFPPSFSLSPSLSLSLSLSLSSLLLPLPSPLTVHLWALSMLKTKTKMVFYTWLTVERTLLDIKVPSPEMLLTHMHTHTHILQ